MTQYLKACRNIITRQMKRAAAKEPLSPRGLMNEIAEGRAILPANPNHRNLEPVAIGRRLRVKINMNLGTSPGAKCAEEEALKAVKVAEMGADAVMDLSTGGDLDAIRKKIIEISAVPVGTVPLYEIAERAGKIPAISRNLILDIIEKQAVQGVDFMTLHAGILRKHLPYAEKRVCGIVSRGGAIMARWMTENRSENPIYENFGEILKIMKKYDVTVSLGDGLRPGSLADASDRAQFGELSVLGKLVEVCRKSGVQVMVEGPGHVPINQIEMNVRKAIRECRDAPFYVLGPLVTDIALGYDHINAAIGAAIAARSGAAFLCGVSPAEHISIPDMEDLREGLIAFKIAARAWDAARGLDERDLEMSRARYAFDWKKQMELSIAPEEAGKIFRKKKNRMKDDFCSMCGKRFCAMRNFRKSGRAYA